MEDDELAQQLATQQPDAPTGPSSYHNRTATLADGTRVIWQEQPNGRGGRFVRMSESTASPAARDQLSAARANLGTYTRVAPLAEEFIQRNQRTPTGSWGAQSYQRERIAAADPNSRTMWHGFNMPMQAFSDAQRHDLDRMFVLQDQALKERIQPGTSGAANTAAEQLPLRAYFPSLGNHGDSNLDGAAQVFTNRALGQMQVRGMQEWLTRHPDLNGWDAKWNAMYEPNRTRLMGDYGQRLTWPDAGRGVRAYDPNGPMKDSRAIRGRGIQAYDMTDPPKGGASGVVTFTRDANGRIVRQR